jgi:NADH-quinone oxidoreductase subunit M
MPALAALFILLIPGRSERTIKLAALLGSLLTFVFSLHLFYHFDPAQGGMQFEESVPWIHASEYTINHHLGIDGISLFLVILTTFLTPLAILSSWKSITRRLKPYMICLLALETGMIGVFCALDMVLFTSSGK